MTGAKAVAGFLVQTVSEGIAQGRFREEFADADELAQMVWAGVHGIVSLHLAKCDSPWIDFRPLRPTSEKLVEVMVRGLLRDPRG